MIIAFGHRKQQGKDTVVNAISKYINSTIMYDCRRPSSSARIRSFAEPLYEICTKLVPEFQGKDYYDQYPEEKEEVIERIGLSPRGMLIGVGQTLKTNLGSDCFAVSLMNNISENEITLITDLRFPCEVEAVRARGGKCIRVYRPSIQQTNDYADCALDDYEGWDNTIVNDGTLEQLEETAVKLYKELDGHE